MKMRILVKLYPSYDLSELFIRPKLFSILVIRKTISVFIDYLNIESHSFTMKPFIMLAIPRHELQSTAGRQEISRLPYALKQSRIQMMLDKLRPDGPSLAFHKCWFLLWL